MRKTLIFFIFLLNVTILNGQIKVAVLDFENTSTIEKYDGFGKAMSNMLLTDLKNNIHPRKISFLERSQLNKILNEQQLQNTKNFDKNTAVTFGKLAGVKYVILGGVYVLDGICNLNSRMVDVESSEIIYAKESNGKITDWLNLKTKLAEELSAELNNPIQIEEEYTNVEVNEGTISQYSKVIELLESGELEEASKLLSVLTSIQPDFKYLDELKFDIDLLKEQVAMNAADIKSLKKSGGLVFELNTIEEYINNLNSPLVTQVDKRELIRNAVNKFEVDQLNNVKFNSITLVMDYEMSTEEYLQNIKKEIDFIESMNNTLSKEYYIESLLFSMERRVLREELIKEELYKSYMKLVSTLYTLKKIDEEILSIDDFNFLYFFKYFLVPPSLNSPSKKLYVSELNKIFISLETLVNSFLKEFNIVKKNLGDYDLGSDFHRFIKICLYTRILKKSYSDVFKVSHYSLNLGYYNRSIDPRDGEIIEISEFELDYKLLEELKNKINKKFFFNIGTVNSPIYQGTPFFPFEEPMKISHLMIGQLYKSGLIDVK